MRATFARSNGGRTKASRSARSSRACIPRSTAPACSAVSRRCRMSVRSMSASRASWRSSRMLGLISTLQTSAFRLGVSARASSDPLHRQGGLPGPRRPADESDKSRADLDPGKLAGADRIQGRRLPAENIVAPRVEQVGSRLVA